jgi:hypothetical protein
MTECPAPATSAVRLPGRRAADRRIELVAPAAVGTFAHRVAEPLADVVERPARVERVRRRHGGVERRELVHRELLRDRVASRGGDRRHDVDDDERPDPRGSRGGERDRVQAAEAHADERRRVPAEMVEQRVDVGDEVLATVAGRPVRVAVAALIEADDVVRPRERRRDLVEAVGGLRAAVQHEERRRRGRAPLEIVEAQAAEDDAAVACARHASPVAEARSVVQRASAAPGRRDRPLSRTPARANPAG